MSHPIIIAGIAFREEMPGLYVSLAGDWRLWLDMSEPRQPWRCSFEGRVYRRRYDTPHLAIHRQRARIKHARDHRNATAAGRTGT